MLNIASYFLSNNQEDSYFIRNNNLVLEIPRADKPKYYQIIKDNLNAIKHNCHFYINQYIDEDKNIFNNKIKISNIPIIYDDIKIYIGVKACYSVDNILIRIYLLNTMPHVMCNNEIYFEYSTLIKTYEKKFDISSCQLQGMFQNDLKKTCYQLFDCTINEMINYFY